MRPLGYIPWPEWRPDSDIEIWTELLIGLIGESAWNSRRAEVEAFLQSRNSSSTPGALYSQSFVPEDAATWHLYICETYVREPTHYPIMQGARHIPVAKAIMRAREELKSIVGLEGRLQRGLTANRTQFDTVLFEVLVAVAYVRDGWSVAFLEESPTEKRPDFQAHKGSRSLFVECKRKSRVSAYAADERQRWLRMFDPVSDLLQSRGLSLFLDVTFHVPLRDLADDYLIKKIGGKLPLATAGTIVDDEEITVISKQVDLDPIRKELQEHGIRADATRLPYLLFGTFDHSRGITLVYRGLPRPNQPNVIDAVDWAAGAIWSTDAPEAIRAKARYLKRDLADAVSQLPPNAAGIVHWGIDLYEGEQVKEEIYLRTVETMMQFVAPARNLELVYVHIFDFTVPPDQEWDAGETVHWFQRGRNSNKYGLSRRLVLVE